MSTNLTIKGQVTIPKAVRDRMGFNPGDAMDIGVDAEGRVVITKVGASTRPPSRFEALRGVADAGLSTDEIMALTRGEMLTAP